MKLRTILVPTDLSTAGAPAMEYACSLARDTGAKLLIAHVQEPPVVYGAEGLYPVEPQFDQPGLVKLLHQVKPTDPAIACEHRLLIGDPSTEIVRLAQQAPVDLIVMSTHGRTGLRRVLMGSVAEAVVRRASCPVLAVKPAALADQQAAPDAAAVTQT